MSEDRSRQFDAHEGDSAACSRTGRRDSECHPGPVLQARCLGAFEIWLDGRPVRHWSSNRAKSVLRYLIAERRPVPRETLMEALWPGWYPQQANGNLRTAIRVLRQTLRDADGEVGMAWVLFQNGGYLVNPAVDMQVDVDRFEAHWSAGRRLEAASQPAEAAGEFRTALDLYRGDFLEDDPAEDWALVRRELLKDIYLTMLGKLADYSLVASDHYGCIGYCQRILAKDPCREDVYQRLMSCFSRLGQRSTALRWFRVCETVLKRDLDMRPGGDTVVMHRKLLDGEPI